VADYKNYYPSSRESDVGQSVEVFLNKHSRYLLRHKSSDADLTNETLRL